MNSSPTLRSDRIDIRTDPEVKSVIEIVAQLRHTTISAYILESALQKAREDIHKTDRDLFFSALSNPPEPNEALKKLFADSVQLRDI
jgi:uncharacterized protein (DUF1778 family)